MDVWKKMSIKEDLFTVFVPCRKGSERVEAKNARSFANFEGGLIELKLGQLLKVKKIDRIIVSTNDPVIKNFIGMKFNDEKIIIDDRPERLCLSATSTDDLIKYVPSIIKEGNVLWTHVTSPFFNEDEYDKAIVNYLDSDCDSLMSVTEIKKFLWDKHHPINYDPSELKWPRTQDLTPVYEVNSAVFITGIDVYKQINDRIGTRPLLHLVNDLIGRDIDTEEDFYSAQLLWEKIYVNS